MNQKLDKAFYVRKIISKSVFHEATLYRLTTELPYQYRKDKLPLRSRKIYHVVAACNKYRTKKMLFVTDEHGDLLKSIEGINNGHKLLLSESEILCSELHFKNPDEMLLNKIGFTITW